MTSATPSTMLAVRAALTQANSQLPARARTIWDEWIRTHRRHAPPMTLPRMIVIMTITALEDIFLHVGAMQILSAPGLRCVVVLHVPNDAVARIVEARALREGWFGLVHIAIGTQVTATITRLPGDVPVAFFALPCPLAADAIAALPQNEPVTNGGYYIGRADNYVSSAPLKHGFPVEKVIECIYLLLNTEPHMPATLHHDGHVPDPRAIESQKETVTIGYDRGVVHLPNRHPGEELVVTTTGEWAEVCVRQDVDLQPDASMKIRVPPMLIKLAGQGVRLEMRGAKKIRSTQDMLLRVPPANLKPWMMTAYLNRGGGGNPVIRAFAQGIGCRLAYAEDQPEELADIPIVWGVLRESDRIVTQARRQDLPFFYIDHAYFDRGHGKSYRITRNGYEAGPIRNCPNDRVAILNVKTLPWRKHGRDIIVCPPTDYYVEAHGCADWLETTLATLRRVTDRPIVVRTKPVPGESAVPLPEALATAHALVTHSSNVAIEAACLGTPVFVAPSSAAAPIGRFNIERIETPYYPDRAPWLAHLAYNQFTFDEIAQGEALRLLLELEERPFV